MSPQREVQAARDLVRFDASNMDSWRYWVLGLRQTADLQLWRGEVSNAIATMRSLFALKQDKRLPSSLGPTVAFNWLAMAYLQANAGDAAGATQALESYVHDSNEFIAQLKPDDPKRALIAISQRGMEGVLQLLAGEPGAAIASTSAAISAIDGVEVPDDDRAAVNIRTSTLQSFLSDAAKAAIMLGRYPQAEAWSRRALKPVKPKRAPVKSRRPECANSSACWRKRAAMRRSRTAITRR